MGLAVALSHYFTLCKTKAELVVVDVTDREALHRRWLMLQLCLDVDFEVRLLGRL